MGDKIRKWIAVLLAGSILAMIQLVPAGGAVFVRENIENKEILGEKETSLQQTLHARAWVLMDADSGRILAGKDADTAYPMASTTKILTCILALEQGNPDDWVEVSEKAASMPDVQLNMRAGERYRLSDLLYSLMLESHNDSAVAVAEHTMMLILACAKKLVFFDRAARRGDYDIRNRVKGMDLEGKTLGLLGLGKIGHMVAKKAINGFGMEVIGYDPFLPADRWDPEVGRRETMEEIFAGSDIVSIHMPSTPETRNSVDRRLIGMMKPTAYLINAARGDLIREADLAEALQNGAIAGAGLDVFQTEPPSPDDPLFQLPNVTVTPHNAALTLETTDRMGLHAAMGIDEVLSGRQPSWPVVVPKEPRT